jgi:hypothetical protein
MAQRKAFPLRLDPVIYDELQRWANSELRSLNGQIEYLLRRALRDAGRMPDSEQKKHAEDPSAIHKRKQEQP